MKKREQEHVDSIDTGKIIRKHIMKIFWFLKNRIILKTYNVFFFK